jgi:cell division protein ZipA
LVTELRWILLGLSLVLLGGIWWWGARRARQTPQNTEWRETASAAEAANAEERPIRATPESDSRDFGVPPFEPLNIRTAEFEPVDLAELPMTSHASPLVLTEGIAGTGYAEADSAVAPEPVAREHEPRIDFDLDSGSSVSAEPGLGSLMDDVLDRSDVHEPTLGELPPRQREPAMTRVAPAPAAAPEPPPSAPAPNPSESQRIVTVRVSALGDHRWPGTDLLAALEDHGLGFGRYKVFHRKHSDGRTLFCAASLVEPGSFDLAKMPREEFRGLTLFAVLPGPADPLLTIDTLIGTASDLAESLNGVVQDSHGAPLTPQRAEALREDIARFAAVMHGRPGASG